MHPSTIVLKLNVAVSMRSYFYYFSFLKNRVTDHRAGVSSKNIEDFLKGGEELRHMITVLQSHYKNNALEHILQEYKKE
jgi:protein subunit release factor A